MRRQGSPAVRLLSGKLPHRRGNGVAQQKAASKDERGDPRERNEGEKTRGMGREGRGVAARQPVRRTESERGRQNICVYEKGRRKKRERGGLRT